MQNNCSRLDVWHIEFTRFLPVKTSHIDLEWWKIWNVCLMIGKKFMVKVMTSVNIRMITTRRQVFVNQNTLCVRHSVWLFAIFTYNL